MTANPSAIPTPLHDWLRPRLEALFRDALARGFDREAVAAVLVDLVTTPPFDTAVTTESLD